MASIRGRAAIKRGKAASSEGLDDDGDEVLADAGDIRAELRPDQRVDAVRLEQRRDPLRLARIAVHPLLLDDIFHATEVGRSLLVQPIKFVEGRITKVSVGEVQAIVRSQCDDRFHRNTPLTKPLSPKASPLLRGSYNHYH